MEPPLECCVARSHIREPGLGAVDVAVDGGPEIGVELENERPVDAPHTSRGPRHARERTGGGSPVVRRPWTPTLRIVGETPTYDRLSGLDESFLHLERAGTPMHVGAVAVLERDPFVDARGLFRLD